MLLKEFSELSRLGWYHFVCWLGCFFSFAGCSSVVVEAGEDSVQRANHFELFLL